MTAAQKPFTDTRQFKIMRAVVGAANPAVRALLGSRAGTTMNRALMLLEYQGRKSGRTFRTPVGFVRDGQRVVVVTSPTYSWWRNCVGGADVRVKVDGEWHAAHARVLSPDDAEYDAAVAVHVAKRGPKLLRGFGVPVTDDGRVPDEARAEAPSKAHIVLFELR